MLAKTTTRLGLTLAATFLIAGCSDDDVTGPEGTGGAAAYMHDGETASMMAAATGGNSANQTQGSYSGSFSADAQVEISADGETWVELGPPATANVDLRATGERAEVHGEVEVPVGTYSHVRLVLSGPQATLQAGSEIGLITLDANVTMQIGATGDVTVEKTVPSFEITADTRTEITWDLNSHLWVNQGNAEEEEVEEQEFEEASHPSTERHERQSS